MKRHVKCVALTDTIQTAAYTMNEANIGFLPVCDPRGRVVGTITDRDITVRVVAYGGDLTAPVRDFMTKELVTCGPRDDLTRAESLMTRARKSRIVCVDDMGKAVGVVSLSDIAQVEDGMRATKLLRAISARETGPRGLRV